MKEFKGQEGIGVVVGEPHSVDNLDGLTVIRFPANKVYGDGVQSSEIARQIAENIKPGSVIVFPNTLDHNGCPEWEVQFIANAK